MKKYQKSQAPDKREKEEKGLKEEKTKVALVTGGNRGIGAGIVEVFAEKGYDIFLVHYRKRKGRCSCRYCSKQIWKKMQMHGY